MKSTVTLVYPLIKGNSGTKTYVENSLKGLKQLSLDFDTIPIRKIELSIGGKPYFGIMFQYLFSLTKRSRSVIIHALSPDVVIKGTNIVTIHDLIPFQDRKTYIKGTYDKLAYKMSFNRSLKVETVLLSTNVGKEIFLRFVDMDEERIKVIHQSIDHSKFFPDHNSPYQDDGKLNVLMISDFNPRKRIDLLVDKLANDREINFYHIGPTQGWEERYNLLKEKASNAPNIKFMGPKTQEEIRRYISSADLFIYLSDNEGYGLPPLEALACGTNVMVNDLPVFKEVLGDNVFYTDLNRFNRDDLSRAISNRKKSNDLINFSMNYSIAKYGRMLFDLYDSINV